MAAAERSITNSTPQQVYSHAKDHLSPGLQKVVKIFRYCLPLLDFFELRKINQDHSRYSALLEQWGAQKETPEMQQAFLAIAQNYLSRLSTALLESAQGLRRQANGQTREANADLRDKLASSLQATVHFLQDADPIDRKIEEIIKCIKGLDEVLLAYRESGQLSARNLPLPFHFPNAILFNTFYHENAALLQCANQLFSKQASVLSAHVYLNAADKLVLASLNLSPFRFSEDPIHDIDLQRFKIKLDQLLEETSEADYQTAMADSKTYPPSLYATLYSASRHITHAREARNTIAESRQVIAYACHQLSGTFAAQRLRQKRGS